MLGFAFLINIQRVPKPNLHKNLFPSYMKRKYTLFKKFNQKAKQKVSSRLELVSSLGKSKMCAQFSKISVKILNVWCITMKLKKLNETIEIKDI